VTNAEFDDLITPRPSKSDQWASASLDPPSISPEKLAALASAAPDLPVPGPITTAAVIESAEIMKRAIVEAEQALEDELAPMRAKLKEAEDILRTRALDQGETIKGAHIQVQIVAPSTTSKWDDKGLSGAVAMLPENWRNAILAHRKTETKPMSTRIVYK
jgi:hypothetical protein